MAETPPPSFSSSVRAFYEVYWERIRRDTWGEADGSVVRALVGRFEHRITFCPDGVLILLKHAAADSFTWHATSQGIIELGREAIGAAEYCEALALDELVPGTPSVLDFELDVAGRTDFALSEELSFHRLQLRFVPFSLDPEFWNVSNAKRLAERNLAGPSVV